MNELLISLFSFMCLLISILVIVYQETNKIRGARLL